MRNPIDMLARLVAAMASMTGAVMILAQLLGYDIPADKVSIAAHMGLMWGGMAYALSK